MNNVSVYGVQESVKTDDGGGKTTYVTNYEINRINNLPTSSLIDQFIPSETFLTDGCGWWWLCVCVCVYVLLPPVIFMLRHIIVTHTRDSGRTDQTWTGVYIIPLILVP